MNSWPQIILVNGPSSAGKTTLCRALQGAIERPYLCLGFDDFIFFSAPRYYRGADTPHQRPRDALTADGVQLLTTSAPGEPVAVTARFGPVFRRLIDAMAPAVRTLVEGGNAVIFDHVLHDAAMAESCALEVLEERERRRGDRVIGRARGLVDVVHRFRDPDLWVDTGAEEAPGCVAQILAALEGRAAGSVSGC